MQDTAPFPTADTGAGAAHYGAALADKSRLLLVCCQSEALLEQRGRELMAWFRQARPALRLEPLASLEGELVIQRFNDLLAEFSIASAVRHEEAGATERIWILHDSEKLQEQDLRLLAKLQQQFPRVRLSAVVLSAQPERFAALLAAQDRGVLVWPEPPRAGGAPASTAQEAHRVEPSMGAAVGAAAAARSAPADAAARAASPWPATMPGHRAARKTAAPGKRSRAARILMGAVLGFATSTTLAVGGWLWLHSQGQLEGLQARLGLQPKAKATQTQPAGPAQPDPGSAAPAAEVVASAEVSATSTPAGTEPPRGSAAGTGPAATATAGSASQARAEPAGKPGTDTPAPSVVAPEAVQRSASEPLPSDGRAAGAADPRTLKAPPAIVVQGQRWATKLPGDNHLVVHGQFDSASLAAAFMQKHSYLANARVLPAGRDAQGPVLVVTGPFQSESRAQGYIQRLDIEGASPMKLQDWNGARP